MIVVETERLCLRELTPDDAAFILELVNEPAWLRFIGDRNVHSAADALGYIAKVRVDGYARHEFGLWAVTLKPSGEALGICGLVKRETLEHVDVGFAFLARHWGQGFAQESVAAVVRLAHERFALERVVAITDPDNASSQKVLERAGFRFERRVRLSEPGEELALYAHPPGERAR